MKQKINKAQIIKNERRDITTDFIDIKKHYKETAAYIDNLAEMFKSLDKNTKTD